MSKAYQFSNKTAIDDFLNTYVENDVIRWESSDNVPPKDILEAFVEAGLLTQEVMDNSLAVNKVEQAAFLEQYIANRQKYGYSDEEKFEMQAAFGGEEVVDIFTGEVVNYA